MPTTLTRFTSAWSVALQSHPAKHDPKLTRGGGGVGERNKDRMTPKVPVGGRNRTCRKVSSVFCLNPALPPPSVAVCSPQIHKPCMNMLPNIWLMPLLPDARGQGQQTTNPALLTSGRGEIEKRWMEGEKWKGGI